MPSSATVTISMQIPEDAEPGDSLEFLARGQKLELVVPDGSIPGDILEIQVASTAENDDQTSSKESDENVTKINLENGSTLELVSQLPSDHKEAAKSDDTDNNHHQDSSNDGTFALSWQSGKELAQNLEELQAQLIGREITPRRRVLELGSGLGLVGFAFAACLQNEKSTADGGFLPNDARIVLTDLPSAMPLLNFNVEKNRSHLAAPQNVSTRALEWTLERPADDPFAQEPPFDCVLGSDLLYNLDSIPALLATIKRRLHPTRGIVILAVRWRKPDLEREFFRESGLEWELLPVPTTICSLSWKNFGNPNCEESNKYMHQTQISVQGKPTTLANITEDQAKDLPPEEYQAWERAFIQIYLGRQRELSS